MGADFAAWRGAMIRYAAPNRRTEAFLPDLPVATGWWRGLGLFPNAFAIESFMDELALAAGLDPIDFRLRNLPDDDLGARMRACLAAVAELSAWASPPPGGRGRGVALVADVGTVVAEVAEVSVEGGEIRVHKVSAAVDPGRIINPDGARAQVQGAITMGVSATLLEQVEVVDGVLTPGNFGAYPLLTMAKAPEIASVLLQGEGNPHGLGEPPIGPVPAAVANAVFALTGQRLRRLPLRLAG
jgi:isoquinoline 1-oxidoreductase beta subunit